MNSNLLRLNWKEFCQSVILAVVVAVLATLLQVLQISGFAFTSADWLAIIEAGLTALIGVLGVKFLSNEKGKILGRL